MSATARTLISVLTGTFVLAVGTSSANAQWGWGGGSHHHHDSFGHRVDDSGHHVDRQGHHTGSIGVYDWGWSGDAHHHHDRAGHRVDDSGHHIDQQGHHTGSLGIYDQPTYSGSYYTPSYSTPSYSAPSNSVPSNSYTVRRPSQANSVPPTRYSGEAIRIFNPPGSGGDLHYDLNKFHYDISPGESQAFKHDREWTISFDRGEGNGEARYTLSPGVYEFKVTGGGWELFKRPRQTASRPPEAPVAP